jgi:hypothetical protein
MCGPLTGGAQEQVFQARSTIEELKSCYTAKSKARSARITKPYLALPLKSFHWKFIEVEPDSPVGWKCTESPGAAAGTR